MVNTKGDLNELYYVDYTRDHQDTNSSYLDTVRGEQNRIWEVEVTVNNRIVPFKVDTGAEVTAISEPTWISLGITSPLTKTNTLLFGPDQTPLEFIGTTSLSLTYRHHESCSQTVYVIKGLRNNLLGLPAIRELTFLTNVCTVEKPIMAQYPALFKGLRTFAQEYEIKLKPNSQPFALYVPRNVPIPLRSKVKEELQRMENLGVISPVEEPTSWCAVMVVIPKESGAVHICVDLKPLNESVLREVHPMPKVDTTLAQLVGAKVFSKLDANSGFWQIPLAKQSRVLTTFITPYMIWPVLF